MRSIILFTFRAVLALVLSLLVYHKLFGAGIPLTHDGPIHTVRMAGYYLALQQGQFPPRIGPNMANGLGYPVFNYNYPLANMIAVPLIRLHLNYPTAYQFVTFGFIWFGTLGILFLLSELTISWTYQLLAAVLYVVNPFLVSQVFVRGGVGEIAFISLFPWVLWSITQLLAESKRRHYHQLTLSVLGGMLALTHNVLFIFCLPLLLVYSLWMLRANWKRWTFLIIPAIMVFLLSAFFWLPALLEKSMVVLDQAPITLQFSRHFLYFHQLLAGSWSYGFSRPGPVDGLSFSLSLIELLMLLLITGTFGSWKNNRLLSFLWLGTIISFGLTLIQTIPLWQLFPLSFYIQFPWRLLWFGHFFLLLLIAFWAQYIRLPKRWVSVVVVVGLIAASQIAQPKTRTDRTQEEWLRAGETTSTMNENLPKTAALDLAYQTVTTQFSDRLIWTSSPSATVSVTSWNGTSRQYVVTSLVPQTVVERTFFFAGWETRVNGQIVTVSAQDPWNAGLLTYSLSPGTHTISTQFTQHTFARQLGNGLTLFGLLALVTWGGFQTINYRRQRHETY